MAIFIHGYILVLSLLIPILYIFYKSDFFSSKETNTNYTNIDILTHQEATKIVASLDQLMQTEKLYLYIELEVKQVAYIMDISEHKLVRALWKLEQLSFEEYLNNLRIDEACDMLVLPELEELEMEEIAAECGFYNVVKFQEAFEKKIGVKPELYRRKCMHCMS